jgi:hypothetical protein
MRQLGVLMTATQKRLLLALTAVTALATATPTTSAEQRFQGVGFSADGTTIVGRDLSDLCFAEGMPVLRLDGDGNPVFFHALCSFTSLLNGTTFTLNGLTYVTNNSSRTWSCERYDTNLFRFEIRNGDSVYDGGGADRSEIAAGALYPPGQVVTVTYNFTLEPGPTNIAPWLVIGQWHSDWHGGIVQPVHPPLAFFLFGDDRLNIMGAWSATNSTVENDMTLYADPNPLVRGQKYAMKIVTNFMNDETGFAQIWRDGVQIVNYSGPLGYGQATFWKEGIYRSPTNQTIAAWYENTIQTPSRALPGSLCTTTACPRTAPPPGSLCTTTACPRTAP